MSTLPLQKKPAVLCVDDDPYILKAIKRVLANNEIDLIFASSGQEALDLIGQHKVDVIVCDMQMPGMTGAEFLAIAAKSVPETYKILMTAHSDLNSTVSAINNGRIQKYLKKPWETEELVTAVNEAIELQQLKSRNKILTLQIAAQNKKLKDLNHSLEEMVQQRTAQLKIALSKSKALASELEKDHTATLEVLYNIINSAPHINGELALKISQFCELLAKQMNLSSEQVKSIKLAGLFCELGKIALKADVATTPYTKLDSSARRVFNEHPANAELILLPADHLAEVSLIISNQLERFGGGGEPQQKVGSDIPIGARILAVSRDLWTHVGGYFDGKKKTLKEASETVKLYQGSLYDPDVVKALLEILNSSDISPIATTLKGLQISELKVGMTISKNVYNKKHMLLLPKGHKITSSSLEKIRVYHAKHSEFLNIEVDETVDALSTTGVKHEN